MTYEQFIERNSGYETKKKLIHELLYLYTCIAGTNLRNILLKEAFIKQQLDFDCSSLIYATQQLIGMRKALAEAKDKE